MNTIHATLDLSAWIGLARRHPLRWALPAGLIALAAVLFAVVRPPTWQASQALTVRNEAVNRNDELGAFGHADQMKAVQETILELARSRGVLHATLVDVGPPANHAGSADAWPTERDVADFRDAVVIAPPKGTDFGSTEVFYLNVKDRDRDRAIRLAETLCDRLETRFQNIRDTKAQSMVGELANAVRLAQVDLDDATAKLSAIEKEVGPDLAELRILNDATNGDSTLRRTAGEIRTELRTARTGYETNKELLALLEQAQHDQGQLLAAPNQLLESQPALRRLKDGLVDSQIQTAQLKGRMSDEHPLVKAARESEQEIGRHLHHELAIAIRAVKADLRLTGDRLRLLEERLTESTSRLERLAALRAPYANQLASAAHRTSVLQRAEQQLSQARATQASAAETSLISRIDTPDTGTRPLGPGRASISLFGLVGGLLVGLGVLLLSAGPVPAETVEESASIEPNAPRDPAVVDKPAATALPGDGLLAMPRRNPSFAANRPTVGRGTLTGALEKLNGNSHAPKV
ncbi:MAG TPA: hypothetical protein DD670_02720 [Planctomycetaceae bacterium]|nr:hypothetical protein [Planctomycetaceae bacterium]